MKTKLIKKLICAVGIIGVSGVSTGLMAVPISGSELIYADRSGPKALSALFEERQIDIFDINRLPVV